MRRRCYSDRCALMVVAFLVGLAGTVRAGTLYWSGNGSSQGGSGTWNTVSANWGSSAGGPFTAAWINVNNDEAVFGGTAGTVTLGENVQVGGLQFSVAGYTITGAKILKFGVANSLTVSSGTLRISSGAVVTNAGAVSVANGNCTMIITNGAQVFSGGSLSQIGNNNNNNLVLVAGGGGSPSVWNLGGAGLNLGGNSYNASPSNNVLRVDGAGVAGGAVVTNVNGAFSSVGSGNYSADYSSIVVTNGGQFFNKGSTAIGNNYYGPHGSYDSIIIVGGAANSMYYGSSNAFIVADGVRGGAHDNLVYVGAGGVLTNAGYYGSDRYVDFVIGYGHNGAANPDLYNNKLVVTDGGKVFTLGNLTVGYNTGGTVFGSVSNSVLVANGGQVNVPGALYIGVNASSSAPVNYNSLTITNGGRLVAGANSYIGRATVSGSFANNNTASVGGAYNGTNALWNLGSANLYVGSAVSGATASNNSLIVGAGGLITNLSSLIVSAGNAVVLDAGGEIYAGAVTHDGEVNAVVDNAVKPGCGCINVSGNLNVINARLNISGTTRPGIFVIARYGTRNGPFAVTNGLPEGSRIDYLYGGLNQIAVIIPAKETVITVR